MQVITTLLLLLWSSAPLGLAAESASWSDIRVPAGDILQAEELRTRGDIVIEGDVVSSRDLVLDAGGTIVVRGALIAGHGGPGAPGGSVRATAGKLILVAEDARVEAGAGGHGAPHVAKDADARGADGGDGGDVVLAAPTVRLDGQAFVGEGGRGGDAYGRIARGGDGGASGALLVNGAPAVPAGRTRHADTPATLADVLPPTVLTHCNPIDQRPPANAGQDGGNACAHGRDQPPGERGSDGKDDDCILANCCEDGTDGGPGAPGEAAIAHGGNGGPSNAGPAGNGGAAVARGGRGGDGGQGGMGGNSNAGGNACDGGNGGRAGPGGSAEALGGAQGIHLTNCALNGHSGQATAQGGPPGAPGPAGGGGGANWAYNDGDDGNAGGSNIAGLGQGTVPPEVLCLQPLAPILTAMPDLGLRGGEIHLTIVPQTAPSTALPTSYDILRRDSPNGVWRFLRTISADAPAPRQYVDGGLAPSRTYWYQVHAVSPAGGSTSNIASATTHDHLVIEGPTPDLDILEVISEDMRPILTATFWGSGTVRLTLLPPPAALLPGSPQTTYRLYRIEGSAHVLVGSLPWSAGPQTHDDIGLTPLQTYWYVAVPDSPYSESFRTLAYVPYRMGTCSDQAVHTYGPTATATGNTHAASTPSGGMTVAWDSNREDCNGDGVPNDFDGDYDAGQGGAFFGFGWWADEPLCNYGLNVHGGNVAVSDFVWGSNVAFVTAADESSPIVMTDPFTGEVLGCDTDGIISPATDPDDCISPRWVGIGVACGMGGDGGFWVFLLSDDGMTVPTTGTITAF